ncbi:GMP synthase [Arachidicoccus ginsenosidimutans]|uniref:type 1 glutamine amidotransferase n=1 Tax=Arachidicoccus sp. BS20 TaxID=1850526 RepID=UPI0007F10B73|nr:GMP synthase [Arachidicoccus sp. BS20]ANI88040.1 GMP synthase [Arachidicoccus sp. BS20]
MINEQGTRIAVLDMNNGFKNQGLRCILEILKKYEAEKDTPFHVVVFDVRQKDEVPDTSFDVYISSGGPGSPFDEEGWLWEQKFFALINRLYNHNLTANDEHKKHVFFICHSFQLACRFFKAGKVCKRKSTSFGVFPIHKTHEGLSEPLFKSLSNPFYGVDSRDYQVIEPNLERLNTMGASILAIEKERPHVPLERAMMAIRFSPEMIGTQFHPEADAMSMREHLLQDINKERVINEHGEEKYYDMLDKLEDEDKILLTQKIILPAFLDEALKSRVTASNV